jgi:hypothetical protein
MALKDNILIIVSTLRGMAKKSTLYTDKDLINKLKKDLGSQFVMKDLGPTQQILGMNIICDIKEKKLWLP